ncbi:MAG TPA: sulfite exporter TauE/SafE family protein [Puia sp.]|nr:sulfite exporter TauE/SafE family protein [Puia sp.]
MTVQTILLVLIVGIAAGVLSGLVGLGGGVIIVPALVYLLGFSQHQATGTSLGVLLLPAGIFAVLNYYQKGFIDIKVVLLIFIGFLAGGWIGSKISLNIPEGTLKKVFAVVLILIAGKVLLFDK